MTVSRTDIIVAYGDSQTAGFSWGNRLVALSDGRIRQAINRGVSGQSSGTVGVRQGGVELALVNEGVVIESTEPVAVEFLANIIPCNQRTSTIPGFLAGVRGAFTITATGSAAGRPVGTFKANTAPPSPVSVPVGEKFVAEDVVDHPEYGQYMHIIWAGGNDRAFNGTGAAPGTVLAAQAQVERLQSIVDEPRFLVFGPTIYSGEIEGTSGHTRAIEARDQLAAAFPDNFVNVWEYVRDNGMDILGLTPTAEDLTALEGKSMPPQLTADQIHFSTATREGVIAPYLLSQLESRGWLSDTSEGGPPSMSISALNKKTGDDIDEATFAAIDANFATLDNGKADSSEVTTITSDLETKVNQDALNTALSGKVDASGSKTIAGATTFTSAVTTTGAVSVGTNLSVTGWANCTGNMRFGGGLSSADVTATDTTQMYTRFNATSGAKKFTLQDGVPGGRRYVIGNWQGSPAENAVTIETPSGVTINGEPGPVTVLPGETVEVISTGAGGAWHIVSRSQGASAPAIGTRDQLDAGIDTVIRGFSAKDIKDFVDARIADLAQPKE